MNKEQLIQLINSKETEENTNQINEILNRLSSMTEEEVVKICGDKTDEEIEQKCRKTRNKIIVAL